MSDTTQTITTTIEQTAKAFEAWENGFRADPQKFMTADEVATAEVSQLSADRAAYLHELLITAAPTTKLKSHQQRVVDEKAELDTKATALSKFIGESQIFPTIDAAEQERLKEQCEVMWQYSEILGARIADF